MRWEIKFYWFVLRVFCVVALLSIPLMLGKTLLWSQSSEQQSNSNNEHFQTWETLSERFGRTLETHEATLSEALRRVQTSETNGAVLNNLLNQSLMQNESLRVYNSQIGERMQERDEDLTVAYDDINKLEKENLKKIIVILIESFFLVVLLYFWVRKFIKPFIQWLP
jgi:hypothetical protein